MDAQARLREAAALAKEAEEHGDFAAAMEEWRRYRLIQDSVRDPEELLAEGIALSVRVVEIPED